MKNLPASRGLFFNFQCNWGCIIVSTLVYLHPMKFRNANERALYRETVAAVTARLINLTDVDGMNPVYVAHVACEFAVAAVHQLRTTEKAK